MEIDSCFMLMEYMQHQLKDRKAQLLWMENGNFRFQTQLCKTAKTLYNFKDAILIDLVIKFQEKNQ